MSRARTRSERRAILVLESPWALDDSDSNRSSVRPFVEGMAKMEPDVDVFSANFYDKNSFRLALECLCKVRFDNAIIYVAAHGYPGTIGGVKIADAMVMIGEAAKKHGITGLMLGSCFVGGDTVKLEVFIQVCDGCKNDILALSANWKILREGCDLVVTQLNLRTKEFGMKKGWMAVAMACALSGCAESVLDWRNASVSGGLVYEGESNEPYTGRLTNIPENNLPLGAAFKGLESAFNSQFQGIQHAEQMLYGRRLICDTYVSEGYIEGETSCREKSGATRWTASLYGDGMDGEVKFFDASGSTPLLTAEFEDGLENGVRKIYSNESGLLIAEYHFEDGVLHGEQTNWYSDGTKKRHFNVVHDKKTGVLTEWAPNGQKVGEVPYGEIGVNGIVRVWDAETGQLVKETTFVEGEAIGRSTTWNLDGSVKHIVENRADGTSVTVQRGEVQLSPSGTSTASAAPAPAGMDNCVEQWITAFREEVGEDAMVNMEQLGEWKEWCAEGRLPAG